MLGVFPIMLKSQNQGNGFILNKVRTETFPYKGREAILCTCEYIATGQLAIVIQIVTYFTPPNTLGMTKEIPLINFKINI